MITPYISPTEFLPDNTFNLAAQERIALEDIVIARNVADEMAALALYDLYYKVKGRNSRFCRRGFLATEIDIYPDSSAIITGLSSKLNNVGRYIETTDRYSIVPDGRLKASYNGVTLVGFLATSNSQQYKNAISAVSSAIDGFVGFEA